MRGMAHRPGPQRRTLTQVTPDPRPAARPDPLPGLRRPRLLQPSRHPIRTPDMT
jgi:hypothetical protein